MVPRRCRVGRRDDPLALRLQARISLVSSKPTRSPSTCTRSGFPCPWPAACSFCRHQERRGTRFTPMLTVHARQAIRAGLRSTHQLDAVVATIQRTEAVSGLGQPGRIRVCGDDRIPGAPWSNVLRPSVGAAASGWQISQRNATAAGLLYAAMSISTRLPFSPRACTDGRDRLDVRGPHRWGSGPAGTCITNFRTTEANIHQIVEEMNQLFQQGVGG